MWAGSERTALRRRQVHRGEPDKEVGRRGGARLLRAGFADTTSRGAPGPHDDTTNRRESCRGGLTSTGGRCAGDTLDGHTQGAGRFVDCGASVLTREVPHEAWDDHRGRAGKLGVAEALWGRRNRGSHSRLHCGDAHACKWIIVHGRGGARIR